MEGFHQDLLFCCNEGIPAQNGGKSGAELKECAHTYAGTLMAVDSLQKVGDYRY